MPLDAGTTLAMDGFLAILTATIYARVTELIAARPMPDGHARTANRLFALWWAALGGLTFVAGIKSLLGSLGITALAIYTTILWMTLILLVIGLYGLLCYLLYIYSGSSHVFVGLGIAHAGLLIYLLALVVWMRPVAVTTTAWRIDIVYAQSAAPIVIGIATAAIYVPALVAIGLYGTLAFRAHDTTARYRVSVVSFAFLLWFGVSGVATLTGWAEAAAWPLVSRALGLIATGIVVLAYRPPPFLRERWHVEAVSTPEQSPTPSSRAEPPRA